jgi:hypothetical protein
MRRNSKFEILDSIVRSVTVLVVNLFVTRKRSPKVSSHSESVLTNVSVAVTHQDSIRVIRLEHHMDIALLVHMPPALPGTLPKAFCN